MRGLQIPLPASLHQEQFRGRRGGEGDFFFLNVFPPFSPLRKHFFSLSSKGMCEAPNDCVAVFSHHRRKSSFFLLFLCHSSLALSFQLFLRVLLSLIDSGATLSSCFCATSSIRPPSRLSTLFFLAKVDRRVFEGIRQVSSLSFLHGPLILRRLSSHDECFFVSENPYAKKKNCIFSQATEMPHDKKVPISLMTLLISWVNIFCMFGNISDQEYNTWSHVSENTTDFIFFKKMIRQISVRDRQIRNYIVLHRKY